MTKSVNITDSLPLYWALARSIKWFRATPVSRFPKTPWILGHRGARRMAPENTLISFNLAMKHGADGVEFDVLLSRDGVPVVIHDDNVDRTTNGRARVCDLLARELANLDATKLFPGFKKEGVPTLLKTLESLPDHAFVNVELKDVNHFSKVAFVDAVLNDLNQHKNRLTIIVSSFDGELLQILRKKNAEILIALVVSRRDAHWPKSLEYLPKIAADALHLSPDLATSLTRFFARCAQMRLALWTINSETEVKAWLAKGIDGIFTDDVPLIVKAIKTAS